MLVSFFSNFINDHQIAFCDEMYKHLGDNFKFVETENISTERLEMGFENLSNKRSYIIKSYENSSEFNNSMTLVSESDIVIYGSAPKEWLNSRLDANKITIYYSERMFRKGFWRIIKPKTFYQLYKAIISRPKNNIYVLCAGTYASLDYYRLGIPKSNLFKWGYFLGVKHYDIEKLLQQKANKDCIKIVWAARLIPLKHPEIAIECLKYLIGKGYNVRLDLIGDGVMKEQLLEQVKILELELHVIFHGYIQPEAVCKIMEEGDIFLFTSDKREGWGVVINEAMSNGCAVVSTNEAGVSSFLIEQGVNGYIYDFQNKNDLFKKTESLVCDKKLRVDMSRRAYDTMKNVWSANEATDRLIRILKDIISGSEITQFENGPGSLSPVITEKNIKFKAEY